MATRRTHISEKVPSPDEPRIITPASPATDSDVTPAVPTSVILKLLLFTFLMVTLPLGSYFALRDTLFGGNSTYAGAASAVIANVVLIAYIVVAVMEDEGDDAHKQAASQRKGQKAE